MSKSQFTEWERATGMWWFRAGSLILLYLWSGVTSELKSTTVPALKTPKISYAMNCKKPCVRLKKMWRLSREFDSDLGHIIIWDKCPFHWCGRESIIPWLLHGKCQIFCLLHLPSVVWACQGGKCWPATSSPGGRGKAVTSKKNCGKS